MKLDFKGMFKNKTVIIFGVVGGIAGLVMFMKNRGSNAAPAAADPTQALSETLPPYTGDSSGITSGDFQNFQNAVYDMLSSTTADLQSSLNGTASSLQSSLAESNANLQQQIDNINNSHPVDIIHEVTPGAEGDGSRIGSIANTITDNNLTGLAGEVNQDKEAIDLAEHTNISPVHHIDTTPTPPINTLENVIILGGKEYTQSVFENSFRDNRTIFDQIQTALNYNGEVKMYVKHPDGSVEDISYDNTSPAPTPAEQTAPALAAAAAGAKAATGVMNSTPAASPAAEGLKNPTRPATGEGVLESVHESIAAPAAPAPTPGVVPGAAATTPKPRNH